MASFSEIMVSNWKAIKNWFLNPADSTIALQNEVFEPTISAGTTTISNAVGGTLGMTGNMFKWVSLPVILILAGVVLTLYIMRKYKL